MHWDQNEIEEIGKLWSKEPPRPKGHVWKWTFFWWTGFSYGPIPVSALVGLFVVLPAIYLVVTGWLSKLVD